MLSICNHKQYLQNATLNINDNVIKPVPNVPNLGVIFNDMTKSQHVTTICRSVNYHIHNIGKIHKYIDYDTCHAAARALVLSQLDCNSFLNHTTHKDLIRLQKLWSLRVSFMSNPSGLIHPHFLMSSTGCRYIKELYIKLLSSYETVSIFFVKKLVIRLFLSLSSYSDQELWIYWSFLKAT